MPAMTISKTLSILFLASSLAAVGCKKQEPATTGSAAAPVTATATGSAKTETPAATTPPPATTPAPAAAAGAVTFTSDDDYITKASGAMDKVTDIFKNAGTDCDKLAADLTKFATENKSMVVAAQDYEKAHPDAKKKFDDASKTKMTAFEAAAGPAMTACKDSKKVEEAMTKLSSD
jgi:hypothetical protein